MSWIDLIKGFFTKAVQTNWDTAGPTFVELSGAETPPPKALDVVNANAGNSSAEPAWNPSERWSGGWYGLAHKRPAHVGRIGATINPRAIVVHTTDTMPGGFAAIVKSWTSKPGAGNAAHFMIGRTEQDGIMQFAPITKNANHAGGPTSGKFKTPDGKLHHPNTVCVGIELDAGGALKRDARGFYHPDTKRRVDDDDVFIDTRGRGWHVVTKYQRAALNQLCADLQHTLKPFEPGTKVIPSGDYKKNVVPWADSGGWIYPRNCVGHVTLNPVNKTDPGPQVIGWLG